MSLTDNLKLIRIIEPNRLIPLSFCFSSYYKWSQSKESSHNSTFCYITCRTSASASRLVSREHFLHIILLENQEAVQEHKRRDIMVTTTYQTKPHRPGYKLNLEISAATASVTRNFQRHRTSQMCFSKQNRSMWDSFLHNFITLSLILQMALTPRKHSYFWSPLHHSAQRWRPWCQHSMLLSLSAQVQQTTPQHKVETRTQMEKVKNSLIPL